MITISLHVTLTFPLRPLGGVCGRCLSGRRCAHQSRLYPKGWSHTDRATYAGWRSDVAALVDVGGLAAWAGLRPSTLRPRQHAPQPESGTAARWTTRNQNPTRCQFPDGTSTNADPGRSRVQTQTARSGDRYRATGHRPQTARSSTGPPTPTASRPTRPPRHPTSHHPSSNKKDDQPLFRRRR